MTPEKKVKKKIREALLKNDPDTWIFMYVPVGYGMGGVPDYLCCVPYTIKLEDVGKTFGRFTAIEAKAKGGKATALQMAQLKNIAKAGGQALIITGEDLKTEVVPAA